MADRHAIKKDFTEISSLNIDSSALIDQSSSHGSVDDAKSDELDKEHNSPLNVAEECIKSFLDQSVINALDSHGGDHTSTAANSVATTNQNTNNAEQQNTTSQITLQSTLSGRSSPSDELNDKMSCAEETINLLLEASNLAPEPMSDDRLSITADEDNCMQSDFRSVDRATTGLYSEPTTSAEKREKTSEDSVEFAASEESHCEMEDLKRDNADSILDKKDSKQKHAKKHSKKKKKKHKKEKKKKKEKEKKEGKDNTSTSPKADHSSSIDSDNQDDLKTSTFLPSLIVVPSKTSTNQDLTSSSSSSATIVAMETKESIREVFLSTKEDVEEKGVFEEKTKLRKSKSISQEDNETAKDQDGISDRSMKDKTKEYEKSYYHKENKKDKNGSRRSSSSSNEKSVEKVFKYKTEKPKRDEQEKDNNSLEIHSYSSKNKKEKKRHRERSHSKEERDQKDVHPIRERTTDDDDDWPQSTSSKMLSKDEKLKRRESRSHSKEERREKVDDMFKKSIDNPTSPREEKRPSEESQKREKRSRSKSTTSQKYEHTSTSKSDDSYSRRSSHNKDDKNTSKEYSVKSYNEDSSSHRRRKSHSRSPKRSRHKKNKRHRSQSKSPTKTERDKRDRRSPTPERKRQRHRSRTPEKDQRSRSRSSPSSSKTHRYKKGRGSPTPERKRQRHKSRTPEQDARSSSRSPPSKRKQRESSSRERRRSRSPGSDRQKHSKYKSGREERKRSRSSSLRKDQADTSRKRKSRSKSPRQQSSDGKTIPKSFSRYASWSPDRSQSRSPSREKDQRKSQSRRKSSRNFSSSSRSRSRTPSKDTEKVGQSREKRSSAKISRKLSTESNKKLKTPDKSQLFSDKQISEEQSVDTIPTQLKSSTGIPIIAEYNSDSSNSSPLPKSSTETTSALNQETLRESSSASHPKIDIGIPAQDIEDLERTDKTITTSPKNKQLSSSESFASVKNTRTLANECDEAEVECAVEKTDSLKQAFDTDEKVHETISETTPSISIELASKDDVKFPMESQKSSDSDTHENISLQKTIIHNKSPAIKTESVVQETGTSDDVISKEQGIVPTMQSDRTEAGKGLVTKDSETEHISQSGSTDGANVDSLPPPPAPPAPIPFANTLLGQFKPHMGTPGVGFAPHMQVTHPPIGNLPPFPMGGGVGNMDHSIFPPKMDQLPPHQVEANIMGHFPPVSGGPPGFGPAVQDGSNQSFSEKTYQENQTSLGLPTSANLIPFLGDTELPKATNGDKDEPASTDVIEPAAAPSPIDMEMSSPEVDVIEKMNEEFWENEQKSQDEAYEPELLPDEPVFPVEPVVSNAHDSNTTVKKAKKDKKKTKKVKEEVKDEQPKTKVQVLLDRLHRQARVEEEVKLVLKEYYKHRDITKDEYKDILRKAVPQVANSNHSIDPERIRSLVKKYISKIKGARLLKK